MKTLEQFKSVSQGPLAPLSPEEIERASAAVKVFVQGKRPIRFCSVNLQEPSREAVSGSGDIARKAFVIGFEPSSCTTYEFVVTLESDKVVAHRELTDVQPAFMLDEFVECEEAVKADPSYMAALRKRGVENTDLIMVDPWSAGYYGESDLSGRRLARALSWLKADPEDNGYARPIEGLIAIVDLSIMKVVQIEDHGITPIPSQSGSYRADRMESLRDDIAPLEVVQRSGAGFSLEGHHLSWQRWGLDVGFTSREGLVIHAVSYNDKGRERPILKRASLSEMVVPYGDPSPNHNRQNAFDVGEYGIGTLTNSLELGCDCLGTIAYLDAAVVNSNGSAMVIKNAICIHEEDFGILWKHVDWRTNHAEVRRSRRLVVSSIATVGNYEYGFFWYFYQDGKIEFEVKLTGIVNTAAVAEGDRPKYATLLNSQLAAPIHQHFFNVRMEMSIDGPNNSVYESHTESDTFSESNPLGNGFRAVSHELTSEKEAQQLIDPFSARYWKIVNKSSLGATGEPVAYKLMPGPNVPSFSHDDSWFVRRAGFVKKHLWVTPYRADERYAAGDYPNQSTGGEGLVKWTTEDRAISDTELVVWYTMGAHHVVRPEDWPVMPVSYIGFHLLPQGFFDQNPAMDLPPSERTSASCHSC